jgi:hypothetical protein
MHRSERRRNREAAREEKLATDPNLFDLLPSVSFGPKNQPILPGWQFGNVVINYENSSSPEAEREVVSAHSYGRQIGRMMDALCVLIGERETQGDLPKEFTDVLNLHKEIKVIKLKAATRRIEALQSDLKTVKANNPAEYHVMMAALKKLAENG